MDGFPEKVVTESILDGYASELLTRVSNGCHVGSDILNSAPESRAKVLG
jgi:hypothetical protein